MEKWMLLRKGQPKSLYRPGSSTTVLVFQRGRVHFSRDLVGLAAILLAPRRRGRTPATPEATEHDGRTIVLDPAAYRRVDEARGLLDRARR